MMELIKHPVFTEKSVQLMGINQYTFDVDLKLTKPQIKKLIKQLFQVDVISVNSHRVPRKKKRLTVNHGYKPSKKRVILTLKAGQSLNFLNSE